MAEYDYKEYARQMRTNAAKDEYGIIRCSPELWEQIASIIENIPTADVVEVVRCGNCLNRIKGTYPKCQGRKPDDYCSDGIRRERQ